MEQQVIDRRTDSRFPPPDANAAPATLRPAAWWRSSMSAAAAPSSRGPADATRRLGVSSRRPYAQPGAA